MEHLRTCIFRPYPKGMGPVFTLNVWDAGTRWDGMQGRNYLRYRLRSTEGVLFEGADIGLPPHVAIASDEAVENVMSWLTLKPGDTDPDYFVSYTPEQLAFCTRHAEALYAEVQARFCDENGDIKRSA